MQGRGWFSLFRFYGPTQWFFDNDYRPGNFVKVSWGHEGSPVASVVAGTAWGVDGWALAHIGR
jgi:hypothetical protein